MSPEEEVAALKAATREAHEAIKDLRALVKEVRGLKPEIEKYADTQVEETMGPILKEKVDELIAVIQETTDEATKAVFHRFDTVADTLLGADKASRRKYGESLEEMAERRAAE